MDDDSGERVVGVCNLCPPGEHDDAGVLKEDLDRPDENVSRVQEFRPGIEVRLDMAQDDGDVVQEVPPAIGQLRYGLPPGDHPVSVSGHGRLVLEIVPVEGGVLGR